MDFWSYLTLNKEAEQGTRRCLEQVSSVSPLHKEIVFPAWSAGWCRKGRYDGLGVLLSLCYVPRSHKTTAGP